jgi:GAF domain-containing protein/HAMP domain-containing protein
MHNSIRQRLTVAFIGLAVGPLLLVGVVLAWQSFTTQQQQALNLQHEVAQRVSAQVRAFFEELENELRLTSQVQGLQNLDQDRQYIILSELLAYQDVFEELTLFDSQGQMQIQISRLGFTSNSANRAGADEFVIPQTSGEIYYSPIRFEETTGEPLMTIAVPLLNVRTGLVGGVLISDVRIKKIWNLISNVQLSSGQSVYIVDAQNRVVAHRNPSLVLRGTNFNVPDRNGVQPGLTGSMTVLAVETIHLGQQEFNIVVEQQVSEALSLFINSMEVIGAVIVVALIASSILGLLTVRQIVRPIQAMATTAQAISAGDLSQKVQVTRRDELGVLGEAFNSMTAQLGELIDSLEERVTGRTQRLELVATLSEHLTAILKVEELLQALVDQVKAEFGYYHAHVYLVDGARQNLFVAAGVGEAGAKMKAKGHYIPLDAPTSLVANAARTGQIVRVDNVRESADWLPNPLLPETYSEMAVPIILEREVVGVLDVQSDRIAGLDEGDANLLRSLANQVAVAVRNARLFTESETALAEAQAAQERYLEQSWQQVKVAGQGSQYHYVQPGAAALDETAVNAAKHLALIKNQPAIITIADHAATLVGDQVEMGQIQNPKSIVTPIKLQHKAIGTLQLHPLADDQTWTEDDLAVVEAVVDELARTAENLRLFNETREQANFESLVSEINEKLRQAPTLDILAKTAAEALGNVLGVSHSLIKVGIRPPSEQPARNGEKG